jgi:hypothetical protein
MLRHGREHRWQVARSMRPRSMLSRNVSRHIGGTWLLIGPVPERLDDQSGEPMHIPPWSYVLFGKATKERAWIRRRDQNCGIVSNGRGFVDYGRMTALENTQTVALKAELPAPG